MTSNVDPKPGRWILPLVILGMVAFTYVFVNQLPAGAPVDTLPPSTASTTTAAPGGSTSTTGTTVPLAPEVQAYMDEIHDAETRLVDLDGRLTTANDGFDADPRTVSFNEARDVFESVSDESAAVVSDLSAVTPPDSMTASHATLVSEATNASAAADAALDGLLAPPPDTGEARRTGVQSFSAAVANFQQEVGNAEAIAAGG